ncbi:MAG TPA: glycosyltransferase family 25 protein, partial [Phnomibacter sp.]|nr:glycosyltransferase family 25 protein [Phnomibacter sp.]
TIKRATQRHTEVTKALHGLNFSFMYGADCKQFTLEQVTQNGLYNEEKARKNHRYQKPMPAPAIGCSWSHRMVYEDILAKGYQRVLILEDDVRLNTAGAPLLSIALTMLPPNWQMLWLDYDKNEKRGWGGLAKQSWYHVQRSIGKLNYTHNTIRNLYAVPVNDYWLRAGYHDFSNAYALTACGAKALLALQTPIQFTADNLLAYASTNYLLQAYCIRPKLFYQTSQTTHKGESLINP